MNKTLTEYWINDIFRLPSNRKKSNLEILFPELYGDIDLPFPNIYLFQLDTLDFLSTQKEWIARDGFLLLKYFFQKNPSPPKNFDVKIYVHETVTKAVPPAWAKHFFLFSYGSDLNDHTEECHILLNALVPSVTSPLIKSRAFKKVHLTLSLKNIDFKFFNGEKFLLENLEYLNGTEVSRFELNHYTKYSGGAKRPPLIAGNDAFLTAMPQSTLLFIACGFSLLSSTDKSYERKINLGKNNYLYLSDCSVDLNFYQSEDQALLKFIHNSESDEVLGEMPFGKNFAHYNFELWKTK